MLFFLITLFSIVSFASAMSLAFVGVKSQNITPLQRVFFLFGAAGLSIPGLMSLYMLLVFSVILFD